MASRFEVAPDTVHNMVKEIINNNFHDLLNANILVLFDCKKRKSDGKFVIGRLQKANDLIRVLTTDDAGEQEADYVLYLDRLTFNNINQEDQVRIIRHELQHAEVDFSNGLNPYGVRGHEVTDFYDEIEFNKDDPRWGERVALVAASMYSENE